MLQKIENFFALADETTSKGTLKNQLRHWLVSVTNKNDDFSSQNRFYLEMLQSNDNQFGNASKSAHRTTFSRIKTASRMSCQKQ